MGALMTGKSAWASLDLQPGDYIALCFVPDPASGKSHLELGMHTVFTVAAQPVALPLTGQESASALSLIVALGAVALLIAGVAVWLRARKAS
jgi:LPXTG-motif cell wall-anchored protein